MQRIAWQPAQPERPDISISTVATTQSCQQVGDWRLRTTGMSVRFRKGVFATHDVNLSSCMPVAACRTSKAGRRSTTDFRVWAASSQSLGPARDKNVIEVTLLTALSPKRCKGSLDTGGPSNRILRWHNGHKALESHPKAGRCVKESTTRAWRLQHTWPCFLVVYKDLKWHEPIDFSMWFCSKPWSSKPSNMWIASHLKAPGGGTGGSKIRLSMRSTFYSEKVLLFVGYLSVTQILAVHKRG